MREWKGKEILDEKAVREDGSQKKLRVVKIYASHKNNVPGSKLRSITVITSFRLVKKKKKFTFLLNSQLKVD